MVGQLAVIDRTVKAHLRRQRPIRPRVQLADLFEADDLGPEFVRLVDVADVQHQVVDAGRAHRLGRSRRNIGNSVGHRNAPKSQVAIWYSPKMGRASPASKFWRSRAVSDRKSRS